MGHGTETLAAGKFLMRSSRLPPKRDITPMGKVIVVVSSLAGASFAGGWMGFFTSSVIDAALVASAVLVLEALLWNRLLTR